MLKERRRFGASFFVERKQIMGLERMTGDWHQYKDLFLLADEDEAMLARYIEQTERWLWTVANTTVGVAAVRVVNPYEGELMAIAVAPAHQQQGTGSAFLQALIAAYARRGWWTLTVGTGDTGPAQLRFYLKNGFRPDHIRPFFFSQYAAPIEDQWGPLQNMIVFKRLLKPLPHWVVPTTAAIWQPLAVTQPLAPWPVATGDGTMGWSLAPVKQAQTLTFVGAAFDFALNQWAALLNPQPLAADTDLAALWRYWRRAYPAYVVPANYFRGNK
jgi:GNAT superfamily N-acetyltransferase